MRVAIELGVNEHFLFEQGFIDRFDLVELVNVNPKQVAHCIKTSPKWLMMTKPAYRVDRVCPKVETPPTTRQISPVNQDKAFNAFTTHLMISKGSCCYAPVNRYCSIGRQLRAEYDKEVYL